MSRKPKPEWRPEVDGQGRKNRNARGRPTDWGAHRHTGRKKGMKKVRDMRWAR